MRLELELPKKLAFLMEPHPYKVVPHGRGAGTSWNFARTLLIQGIKSKLRIPCARETMQSMKDSVHAILKEQIEMLGLQAHYDVGESKITGTNGTIFTFHGLKHNVSQIKSLEGSERFWVEEAENVSKASWDVLEPTVFRRGGSELWISFNPQLATDETFKRFVTDPRPGSMVQHLTYRDNPFFPEFLEILRLDDLRKDPVSYQNIWEGQCRSAVEGAVFGTEMMAALAEKRILRLPVDRTKPVDTFWDLGFGDMTAIWFAQATDGWYNVVDYIEDCGHTIEHYLIALQQRGYLYGIDWLPHDSVDAIIHKRMTGDRSRSVESLMRAAGRTVRVVPKVHVHERINAARTIMAQCRWDEEKCADGLHALRRYQWGKQAEGKPGKRDPLHDAASHGADAFCALAMSIKQPRKAAPRPAMVRMPTTAWS